MRASLFIPAPLGSLDGDSFTAVCERYVREDSGSKLSVSMVVLRGKPGGRALLMRALKNILRTALKTDISLHRGPIGEPGGEVLLPGF
jgi:hypothetical protein